MNLPLMHEVTYAHPLSILNYFEKIYPENIIFFDSSGYPNQNFETGRYSYIGFDPSYIISTTENQTYINNHPQSGLPFDCLKKELKKRSNSQTHKNLPPFQGGFAGYFGYELLHTLEKVPQPKHFNPIQQIDNMRLGFYDCIIAFDHYLKRTWIFCCNEQNNENRLNETISHYTIAAKQTFDSKNTIDAPLEDLLCDFSQGEFENAIQKILDYIIEGDIFQANMTRRIYANISKCISSVALYHRLSQINPAPFSAFYQWNVNCDNQTKRCAILSSSPERFLQLNSNGHIETRPIKGTRKKSLIDAENEAIIAELSHCEKDLAENMMIVDLMRNDLSRVCEPFSVKTPKLCAIETYKTVHHLVSTIEGQLCKGLDAVDLLKATFPGGSITGAPKVRAMQIISELERAPRGPYCGSMGYIGIDGAMDTSILIRTIVLTDDLISFHVGGGIVADSNPTDEWQETCTKAKALNITLKGN